jgi:hypothetical protein
MGGGIGNKYLTLCTIASGCFTKLKMIWSQVSENHLAAHIKESRARLHKYKRFVNSIKLAI